ncbi:MAG: hypothetical protein IKJ04_06075 [Clostridia bacterium]|nr:hypothetical protein [Clostridia bacterium]
MNKKTDKRLLASLDYIDEKFTDRAAKRIKSREVGVTGGISKKKTVKYLALIAACAILLGAAIPIATSLLNKLPEVIDPSASNDDTTAPETTPESEPDPELPEEYFCQLHSTTSFLPCKYNGQFIYVVRIQDGRSYCNIVKYDPVSNVVSHVCLDPQCAHTPEDCPLASPEGAGWNMNYMEVFGDWLLYDYSYSGADKVIWGSTVCLYNLKTGESQTVAQTTNENTIYKYVVSHFVINGKVYLSLSERELEYIDRIVSKDYIVSYDPETGETERLCNVPDGMLLKGISNKRFFFIKYTDSNNKEKNIDSNNKEIWSTNHKGENLQRENVLDFYLITSSLNYAYNSDYFEKTAISAYDLLTDTKFEIDFGAKLRFLTVLEDHLLYVIYKSDDESGGTELWTCDNRGENRKLLYEFEDSNFIPRNRIGNYIVSYKSQTVFGGVTAMRILNLETGEIKNVPRIQNQD